MTRIARARRLWGAASFLAIQVCGASAALAQDSGFTLAFHAHSHATAADIGLPEYPGATPYKRHVNDDGAVDLGFTYGDTHFSLLVAGYKSSDTPDRILSFYRRALSQYGEVLECNHGKPVGKLTVTRSGLTCSAKHGARVRIDDDVSSSDDYELRAGSPRQSRIVGVDLSRASPARFVLMYLEMPKDHDGDDRSE